MRAWVVSMIRYGAGMIKWNEEELDYQDWKIRKNVKRNKELHPKK